MAPQVKNPTSIHEDVGWIPGCAQRVKDPVLLQAPVKVTDAALIQCFCGYDIGWQLQLQFSP